MTHRRSSLPDERCKTGNLVLFYILSTATEQFTLQFAVPWDYLTIATRFEEYQVKLIDYSGLLRCDASSLGEWLSTFRRDVLPSSSGLKMSLKNGKTGSVVGVWECTGNVWPFGWWQEVFSTQFRRPWKRAQMRSGSPTGSQQWNSLFFIQDIPAVF